MKLALTPTMPCMTSFRQSPVPPSPVALVTGASRGLGHALTAELVRRGWHVVVDARDADRLDRSVAALPEPAAVTAIAGDVVDDDHRRALAQAVHDRGGLDLLVSNASVIGPSPLPLLADHPLPDLLEVFEVNALAPIALLQLVLPALRSRHGRVVHISSDAAVEPYACWGGYGAAKAALDHASAVLAVENPDLRIYAFDPGDMNTALRQLAAPGEDLSALPDPARVVPALLRLVQEDLPSGRYQATELAPLSSSVIPAVTG